ncbi:MAG: lipopolysaccharide transport periplasmic protein LptA [Succinivibrionaceae bacterium]
MQLFNRQIFTGAISVAVFCIFLASSAGASEADRKEKITIDSNSQFADMNSDHLVFTDNVIIHQGSILITADKVEVFQEKPETKQHRKLVAYGSRKKLAVYEETLDDGTRVHAEGLKLSYDVTGQMVVVEGNGYIRKQDNEIHSEYITYDRKKNEMHASSTSAGKTQQRVHTIIFPEQLEQKQPKK